MLKYIILGISHPHTASLYAALAALPNETVCLGYADTPAHDLQDVNTKIRENLGRGADVLNRFDDYRELIAMKPDLAIVCCDNADCGNISLECIENGINVALEKPMTASYEDAELLCKTASEKKVKLIVNWPIAEFPAFNKAKELCGSGYIGKIMRVVYRSPATWGPYSYSKDGQNPPLETLGKTWWYMRERGGGSVLDYACYGTALATWFFGCRALNVKTVKKNFCLPGLDVEDYSAMLLDFGAGVGLLEGSWSTYNCGEIPSGPVIYGDKGTVVCDRHSNLCKLYTGRSHSPLPPAEVFDCSQRIEKFTFARDVIAHLTENKPLHPLRQPELNLDVMYVLDKALREM